MIPKFLCKLHMRASFPKDGISAINQRNFWKLVSCQRSSQGIPRFLIDTQSGALHVLGKAKPLESYLEDYIKEKAVKSR